MDSKNEIRYDLILGFVTVVLSLSAFKDELSQVTVELSFITFTLSQFFFIFILGTTTSFYLYSLERLFSTLTIKQIQFLSWIRKIAYWIFLLFTLSPLAVIIVWVFSQTNLKLSDFLSSIVFGTIGGVTGAVTTYLLRLIFRSRKEKQVEELKEKEIIELEMAEKLFEQNFYSQSIIETNKVIETHLQRLLRNKNIEASRAKFVEVIKYCLNKEIINKSEFEQIEKIRRLRNSAAHLDTKNTKEEAESALSFSKELIRRTQEE
jgi:HEPN domain-containing protein